jgi:beta-glucosidase
MPTDPPAPRHHHDPLKFPKEFLWGAATSAHQVEGNNTFSDWWDWEQSLPTEKRSLDACDHYNKYKEDFDMLPLLGHTAHRLSIEWSRIEPREGFFDTSEIDHYKQVLKSLKDRNITVFLTLQHFTIPQWLAEKGGWENGKAVQYFERFVQEIVPELQQFVDFWITINEPGVYVGCGYLLGKWPPQKKSKISAFRVFWNLAKAHQAAYKIIHNLVPKAQVGIANNVATFGHFHKHSLPETLFSLLLDIGGNHTFYYMTGMETHDFLGVNYYFNRYIGYKTEESRIPGVIDIAQSQKQVSDLGWEIYPQGMFEILMDLSDYKKPIYITENGIASTNDDRRVRYLLSYLQEIYHAISSGVDVRGYLHWSLMDNFEWADGFEPRFGLVEIEYKKQKRIVRPSAFVYREIIQSNSIPHHLLKLLGHGIHVEDVLKTDPK